MSNARGDASADRSGERRDSSGDVKASVARLERAVNDLVSTTRAQVSDRTTAFLDETTRRLERELDRRQRRADDDPGRSYRGERPDSSGEPRSRRLYRDPSREKIGGVCAGIARYYGVEPWLVRCIAVTGLLFFPTIVFPAYWIAYFVMDKPPGLNGSQRRRGRGSRRACSGRSDRHRAPHDHRSPAPELGPRFSPRNSLRNIEADLTEVELRLRRMETHVTSEQYELQRELAKIDGGRDGRSR